MADYRIVESLGATEGAPASGAAELIVDITTTGATLAANALKVIDDGVMLRSEANLVASVGAGWGPRARKRRRVHSCPHRGRGGGANHARGDGVPARGIGRDAGRSRFALLRPGARSGRQRPANLVHMPQGPPFRVGRMAGLAGRDTRIGCRGRLHLHREQSAGREARSPHRRDPAPSMAIIRHALKWTEFAWIAAHDGARYAPPRLQPEDTSMLARLASAALLSFALCGVASAQNKSADPNAHASQVPEAVPVRTSSGPLISINGKGIADNRPTLQVDDQLRARGFARLQHLFRNVFPVAAAAFRRRPAGSHEEGLRQQRDGARKSVPRRAAHGGPLGHKGRMASSLKGQTAQIKFDRAL